MSGNRYDRVIEEVFLATYSEGASSIEFSRDELEKAARRLSIALPKNLGDIIYSFRYRTALPERIRATALEGKEWVIRLAGRSTYRFELRECIDLTPSPRFRAIRVPDATPGVVVLYSLQDEQALLAKVRYNRLIDIFTSLTCYSLQNHMRTTVPGIGQVETDELYVGIESSGNHYVIPVQAKGRGESLGIVQIEQDFELCAHKFPNVPCRPVAAQFMEEDVIALFSFIRDEGEVRVLDEKHYRLVEPEEP